MDQETEEPNDDDKAFIADTDSESDAGRVVNQHASDSEYDPNQQDASESEYFSVADELDDDDAEMVDQKDATVVGKRVRNQTKFFKATETEMTDDAD